MLHAIIPAVSVLNILFPIETEIPPEFIDNLISSSEKSPSGPIRIVFSSFLKSISNVIKSGMQIVGVETPEKM